MQPSSRPCPAISASRRGPDDGRRIQPEAPDDEQLWAALIDADHEFARRRLDFHQHARSRTLLLARALDGSNRDRAVALRYLQDLGRDDVPTLLDRLIELSLSHGLALAARQAIAPSRRTGQLDELDTKVIARLDTADDDEYRRLAELLVHLEAWTTLGHLIQRALASTDPHTREAGNDFMDAYGPILSVSPRLS